MNMVKGIYHNGIVEPIGNPHLNDLTEVIIIFPDTQKSIKKLGGLYKNHHIDFDQLNDDLKRLTKQTEKHLMEKGIHE